MPNYTFLNKNTNESFSMFMKNSEREEYLEKNPHIIQVLNSINIVSGVSGITHKNDEGWKENLSRIAEANPTSKLADNYGDSSSKAAKTREAVRKWRQKTGGVS